jgi:MOSC domain-containing protein YiiM
MVPVGTIIQVNISLGGLPKRAIAGGYLGIFGIEGDAHRKTQIHGGPRKAVLLVAAEVIDDLAARGFPVFYGALGENLTTRGLDFRDLRVGDRLRAGGAMLEITAPRMPCSSLDVYGAAIKDMIFDRRVKDLDPLSPRWGMSGLHTAVLAPGPVAAGDPIEVLARLASGESKADSPGTFA